MGKSKRIPAILAAVIITEAMGANVYADNTVSFVSTPEIEAAAMNVTASEENGTYKGTLPTDGDVFTVIS